MIAAAQYIARLFFKEAGEQGDSDRRETRKNEEGGRRRIDEKDWDGTAGREGSERENLIQRSGGVGTRRQIGVRALRQGTLVGRQDSDPEAATLAS